MMSEEKAFINKVKQAVDLSIDMTGIADNIAAISVPIDAVRGTNTLAMSRIINDFRFTWQEFDGDGTDSYIEAEEKLVTAVVNMLHRIISDIEAHRQYRSIFSAEIAYSRLQNNEYSYKIISQNMLAKSEEEADTERGRIRINTPYKLAADSSYTLEDVRVINAYGQIIHKQYAVQ